jgi:hypothetical protein
MVIIQHLLSMRNHAAGVHHRKRYIDQCHTDDHGVMDQPTWIFPVPHHRHHLYVNLEMLSTDVCSLMLQSDQEKQWMAYECIDRCHAPAISL